MRRIRFDRVALLILTLVLVINSVVSLTLNIITIKTLKNYKPVEIVVTVKNEEEIAQAEIEEEKEIELESLGTYKLTGYCSCSICCGQWADGITASGTVATEGRTIAVDVNKIPLGSKVMINGNIYIAEDTGSAIRENRIDIYKDSHSACFAEDCNGYAEVYLVVE